MKIDWIEFKETATGKKKADVTLIDENGKTTDVTIWGDFPGYSDLIVGQSIEGEIKAASDPKFKPSFNAPRSPKTASTGAFKAMQIEKAQDRKESSIGRFQASKEESIKMAGAQRDAVLMVSTLIPLRGIIPSDNLLRDEIIRWRDWFLSDKFEEHPPF